MAFPVCRMRGGAECLCELTYFFSSFFKFFASRICGRRYLKCVKRVAPR